MNTEELTLLLTRMSIVDGREVDALTIEAWEPLVGNLDYRDAVEGVNAAYRVLTRRPTPADIREAASSARTTRIAREQREQDYARRLTGLCIPHTAHYVTLAQFESEDYVADEHVCTGHHFSGRDMTCDHCRDRVQVVGSFIASAIEGPRA